MAFTECLKMTISYPEPIKDFNAIISSQLLQKYYNYHYPHLISCSGNLISLNLP